MLLMLSEENSVNQYIVCSLQLVLIVTVSFEKPVQGFRLLNLFTFTLR